MQEAIVILVFVAAVAYMARNRYRQYKSDQGCASGCASCEPPEHLAKPGQAKSAKS